MVFNCVCVMEGWASRCIRRCVRECKRGRICEKE